MKTIYRRKTRREAQGKKMTSADSRYFKAAQDALYNELAVSLQIPAEEVHEFIKEKLGK